MGLDWVDISLRTEHAFGIRIIEQEAMALFMVRQPPDITAGEFYDFIRGACYKQGYDAMRCFKCGYPRRGLPESSKCPECGRGFDDEEMWRRICRILSDAIGCELNIVQRDSLLKGDLGASM
jgi:hypothetical protein